MNMRYSRTDMRDAKVSPTHFSTNDKRNWNFVASAAKQERTYKRGLRKKKKGARQHDRVPKQYKVYIKSQHWQNRKNRYYQANGRRCAVCNSAHFIDLHHRVYGNYGSERDEDLVPLCKKHHEAFHQRYGVRGNMKTDTDVFVATALFDEHAANVMKNL